MANKNGGTEESLLFSASDGLDEMRTKRSNDPLAKDCCPWVKCRVVVTLMAFLGFVNIYILRVNLSMAIVVMANDTGTGSSANYSQQFKTIGKPRVSVDYCCI